MEQILIEIEVDNNGAKTRFAEIEKALIANRKEREKLRAEVKQAEKEGREADTATLKRLGELEASSKKLNQERAREIKLIDANSNSMNALRQEISKLNAERNELDTGTLEGKKRFDELTQTLKGYNETINSASKESGNFKDNIGNYSESVKEAINETSVFGVKIGDSANFANDLGSKIKGTGKAFLEFGKVLLSNPIFLLAAVLAAVVGAFLSTEKGIKKLEVALAPLKAVFNGIYSAVASFGEIVFKVVELMSDGFGAVADLFGANSKGAKQLVKDLQDVEAQQVKIEATVAKQKADAEKLRTIRDNERLSDKERLKSSEDLLLKLKERESTEIGFLNKKIALAQRELESIPENLRTQQQIDKVLLLQKEKQEAIEDIAGQYTEQITSQKGILDQINERLITQIETQLRLDLATGKVREDSIEQLNSEIKAIEKRAQVQKSNVTDLVELANIERVKNAEIAEKRKAFAEAQQSQFEEFQEKQKEARDKALQDDIARLDLLLAQTDLTQESSLETFSKVTKRKAEIEIETTQATADQSALIRFNALKEIENKNEEFRQKELGAEKEQAQKIAEYNKLESEAIQRQTENNLNFRIEALAEENELIQSSLDEELARITTSFEQKRSLLNTYSQIEVENLESQKELKLSLLDEELNKAFELYELDSEQFAEFSQTNNQARLEALSEYERNVNDIKRSAYEQNKQINELEAQSEINKVKTIAGLAGTVAGALGAETQAGKIAGAITAQINAGITASNVFRTLTSIGVPAPFAFAGAGAAFVLAQKFGAEIEAINTGVQKTATAINPALQFASGGKVPFGFELPYSTPQGDNTLALVKPGEVVLNKSQQFALGGDSTFANIGVKGFASGGLIESQNTIANIQNSVEFSQIARAISKMPAPVVSVVDITKQANKVRVKDSVATL